MKGDVGDKEEEEARKIIYFTLKLFHNSTPNKKKLRSFD